MSVLITGGYGQIASWIARFVTESGRKAILYDLREKDLDYLRPYKDSLEFIRGDVLDYPHLASTISKHCTELEGIIHTAGVLGELVANNAYMNIQLNVTSTLNVLEASRLFGVPKILYTGTGAVYPPGFQKVSEDVGLRPADLYGATKASSEFLGSRFADLYGLDFRISRVYFIYGPGRMPSGGIKLYRIAFGALEGLKDLRMPEGSDQRLDFTYVEDAARGILMHFDAPGQEGSVFNIATEEARSIADVAELCKKHSHFKTEVHIGPGILMERSEALDCRQAREKLGYAPRVDLEEGIRRYADWIRDQSGTVGV